MGLLKHTKQIPILQKATSSFPDIAAVPYRSLSLTKTIITLAKRNTRHISKRINLKMKSQQIAEQWWRVKI